jgi:hypothetical protein
MSRTVTCSCGYVLRANSDAELYTLVRRHIIPMDREIHHPIVLKRTPMATRASANSPGLKRRAHA